MIIEQVSTTLVRLRFEGDLADACARTAQTAALLRDHFGARAIDVWQGVRAVMVDLQEPLDEDDLEELQSFQVDGQQPHQQDAVELRVEYNGEDLASVAQTLKRSVSEVVELHSTSVFTVAFVGFAPGFPYLFGTPTELASIPRRTSPRPRVSPGSLAVAGGWTGIYPSAMPGGWHLLGTIVSPLPVNEAGIPVWEPGQQVRFRST